jgi:DNA-binding NtrC family response regulator
MGESSGGGRGFVERRSGARLRVPGLTVLWHPELARVGDRVRLEGLLRGGDVALTRTGPGFQPPGAPRSRPLEHPALEGLRLRFSAGGTYGAVRIAASGSGGGIVVDGVPLSGEHEVGAEEVEDGVVLELRDAVVLLLHHLPASEQWEARDFGLVGENEVLVEVRREIRRVADLEIPVLLRGETGTGKELMARALHRASRRRDQPYLSVNLGAIPPSLAVSELFGAAKGAFTGAVQAQAGYFARAHRGTLFLDEVGEAPPEVQVMLLRALESGEIQPLGVQEVQHVDVRLIAAADVDLERVTAEGSFRAPLFHRLAGYEIVVPPMRERRDDFGRLLVYFLREELESVGEAGRLEGAAVLRWLPASIVARLARHDWPGNVRQLRNVARQIAIGSRGVETVRIGPQLDRLLHEAIADGAVTRGAAAGAEARGRQEPAPEPPARRDYRDPSEVGEEELLAALRRNRWAVKPTADDLGISRTSLYALIDRSPSVRKAADLGADEIAEARRACAGDLEAMSQRLEVSPSGLKQRIKDLGLA